jgi:hypothetical protein
MGISLKSVLIEAYNLVGIVERYYRLIRRAYQIISVELPNISKEMALQMAFKAINNIANPNSLILTLLVFGAYLRIVESDSLSLSVTQRASAIKRAMEAIRKL